MNRFKARLIEYQKKLIVEKPVLMTALERWGKGHIPRIKYGRVLKYDISVMEKLRDTWSSYMAHFKMANAYLLKKRLAERFSWIGDLFYHDKDRLKIVNRAPSRLHTLRGVSVFSGKISKVNSLFSGGAASLNFTTDRRRLFRAFRNSKKWKQHEGFVKDVAFTQALKERYLKMFFEYEFWGMCSKRSSVWVVQDQEKKCYEVIFT